MPGYSEVEVDPLSANQGLYQDYRAPTAAIEALEGLIVDQHKVWKLAIGKIKKVLEQ